VSPATTDERRGRQRVALALKPEDSNRAGQVELPEVFCEKSSFSASPFVVRVRNKGWRAYWAATASHDWLFPVIFDVAEQASEADSV